MSSSRRVPVVPLVLGALLAAVLATLTPTAAHAATSASPDSRSDVVSQSGARPGHVDADRANGDVTSSRVVHGRRAVTLELRFANAGTFMFHAHQSEFTELGWMGYFQVEE